MSSLAWTSFLSIVADFIMIIFVVVSGPSSAREQETEFNPKSDFNFVHYQLFLGIGTFSFAFVCQHNTFLVYQTLPTPNLRNWSIVSHISLTIAVSFCLVLGLAGYLSFGQYTEGDILNNFADSDRLILVGRLLLASTMVFTYPMECYVARHIIFSYYDYFNQQPREPTPIVPPPPQPSLLRRFARSATPKLLKSFAIPPRDNPILRQDQQEENHHEDLNLSMELDEDDQQQEQQEHLPPLHVHVQSTHHPEDLALALELSSHGSPNSPPPDPSPSKPMFIHVAVTLLLWGTTVLIALAFSELSIVLALTGLLLLHLYPSTSHIPLSLSLRTFFPARCSCGLSSWLHHPCPCLSPNLSS
jgi:hypothetical protein